MPGTGAPSISTGPPPAPEGTTYTNTRIKALLTQIQLAGEDEDTTQLHEELSQAFDSLGIELESTKELLSRVAGGIERKVTDQELKKQELEAQHKELEERITKLQNQLTEKTEENALYAEDLEIKLPKPENFDGKIEHVKPFLTQCEIVFKAYPKKYNSIRAKLLYVLSFCHEGEPARWRQSVLNSMAQTVKDIEEYKTEHHISSIDAVKFYFTRFWLPLEEKITAQHKLTKLKQGQESVKDFNIIFLLTSEIAELGKEAELLAYKKALKPAIRNRIYESGDIPEKLQEWMERALKIDKGWRESQIFMDRTEQPWRKGKIRVFNNESKKPFNRLPDDEYQKRKKEGLCFKCGQKGHMANKCYAKARTLGNDKEEEESQEDFH